MMLRLLAVLAVIATVVAASPATTRAQPAPTVPQLRAELNGLRMEAEVLQAQAAGAISAPQLQLVEEQLRVLTGKIEAFEFRLRQLEQGGVAGVRAPAGGQPADAPTPGQAVPGQPGPGQAGPGDPPRILGQIRANEGGAPLDLTNPNLPGSGGTPVAGAPSGQPGTGAAPAPGQQAVATPGPPPRDLYDMAYGLVLRGEYAKAEQAFRDFVTRHPGDELVPNARFWIGETHFQRGDFQAAARAFLDVSQSYPAAPKAPESLLKLGQSLAKLDQRDPACSTFAEMLRKYPRAEAGLRDRVQAEIRALDC